LALHRPRKAGARRDDVVRNKAEGDRRQTVADSATSIEEVLKGIIGQPTEKSKVVIERGTVQHFADAVFSTSPIYHDPAAAKAAGFANIPAPPTFPFAMEFSGKFDEIQPSDAPVSNPLGKAIGPLMAKGGLILHGEQEFIYHRPVQVGDVLIGEGKIADAYQKESKGRTMTFIVQETNWSDDKTGEPVVTTRFNVIHRA
jgi:acyl dehydratase